ncbi:hypothetical protein [Jiangella alkaliphila]|uniref:Uncharacterized protein n=1 Tax=Jiangella alkaliphila TaxID=419479 RepID=A0A1H2GH69_9ACTN|nr:hypothetical protein [Jiangella alkaliphila]SDU18920.1 hypothetical protein SAMN04488563_0496 [Jiangella alkaliphila]
MANIYGAKPKPWIIADGIAPGSELGKALAALSSHVAFLESGASIDEQVRQAEFDAYVVQGIERSPASHLYVLQFSDEDRVFFPTQYPGYVEFDRRGVGERLAVPSEGLSAEVSDLANRSLAPYLLGMRPRFLILPPSNWRDSPMRVSPIVLEEDGDAAAGYWNRTESSTSAQWWWLPSDTPQKGAWLSAVLNAWRQVESGRFPETSDWTSNSEWFTAAETRASDALLAHGTETTRIVAERAAQGQALEAALDHAGEAAAQGQRRLLTAQGDDLVDEVRITLELFGFRVVDSDGLPKRADEKLEDLQVWDGDWVALVEVKGYGGRRDAKVNDLQQFRRPAVKFALENHREPDALWYVVNQRSGMDPASRPLPLISNPDAVHDFANDGGMVVDTAQIFKFRTAVEAGAMRAADVLQVLKGATGVVTLPAE